MRLTVQLPPARLLMAVATLRARHSQCRELALRSTPNAASLPCARPMRACLHPHSDHVLHGYRERTGFASFSTNPTDALLYALFEHAKTGPAPPPSSGARLTPARAALTL